MINVESTKTKVVKIANGVASTKTNQLMNNSTLAAGWANKRNCSQIPMRSLLKVNFGGGWPPTHQGKNNEGKTLWDKRPPPLLLLDLTSNKRRRVQLFSYCCNKTIKVQYCTVTVDWASLLPP